MAISDRDLCLLAVGGAFLALAGFIAHNESGDSRQPRYAAAPVEHAGTESNPNLAVLPQEALGDLYPDNYFHPAYCVPGQGVKFMAHRYPRKPGIEITTILHHGVNAMMRAAPQDDDWRIRPPGEAQW